MQINCVPPRPSAAALASIGQNASDLDLIHWIGHRRRFALEILFARHSVKTFRFVLHLVRDVRQDEDIMSEIYLDVSQQPDRYREGCSVTTSLLVTARNKSLSALRRRRPIARLFDERGARRVEALMNVLKLAGKEPQNAGASNCLSQLSTAHREMIDLVYYHG